MSLDAVLLTLGLGLGTFAIRLGGALAGEHLGRYPMAREALERLPGCLIVALIVVILTGKPLLFSCVALCCVAVAWTTKNLLLTMLAGMGGASLIHFLAL
jgi:branched-subunit amino acid transport protein